jgi:hypothetical protein
MSKPVAGGSSTDFTFSKFAVIKSEEASVEENYNRTITVIAPDINYIENQDGSIDSLSWEPKEYRLRIYSDPYMGTLLIDYGDFDGEEPNGWKKCGTASIQKLLLPRH